MSEPMWLKILAGAGGGLALVLVVWRFMYVKPVVICGRCRNYAESCTCPSECPECGALIAQNVKFNPLRALSLRQELPGGWHPGCVPTQDAPVAAGEPDSPQGGTRLTRKHSASRGAERP